MKLSSDTPIDCIRVIRLNEDTTVNKKIFTDEIFNDETIKSVNQRGEKAVFVKFETNGAAESFEDKLKNKYSDGVNSL